ncbi:MAG: toprim domain-containing protein [Clostridium sp.]|nr:MAG: toprim domain-containing protein [Clostridium sp.]
MGTALTVNHVRILKKFTNNIVLCYDGDKAGLTASKRAINLLEQNGMQIHIVMLPDSLDPDEYVRKYGELAYQKYFTENQLDAVEFLFRYAIKFHNLNDFNEVVAMKNEIFEVLLKANSESTAEVYLGKLASSLNVSIDAVKADYRKYCNTARNPKKYVEYIPDDKKN